MRVLLPAYGTRGDAGPAGLPPGEAVRGRPRREWPVMDAGVIIVGAGPTGLMLAGELCLAGVRPLVLERQPRLRETPKANGFNGQIVELVRYRGLLDRVEAASGRPVGPAPGAPFGGVQLDFSHLADPPIWAVHLPQPRLERLLDEHARELGAEHTPRTRGGRGQPGRRHGDRRGARPGRALPGERPVPGGLRRPAQQGPRRWPGSRSPAPPIQRSTGWARSPWPIR